MSERQAFLPAFAVLPPFENTVVRTMPQDLDVQAAEQQEGQPQGIQEKRPLPSRWWIVVACLVAGIAIGGQAFSIFGHMGFVARAERLGGLDDQIQELETQLQQLKVELAASKPILDDLRSKIGMEMMALEEIQREQKETAQKVLDQKSEASALAAGNKVLAKFQERLKEERAELDIEVVALRGQHGELLEKVGLAKGELAQLSWQIATNAQELARIKTEISQQNKLLNDVTTQVGGKRGELQQLTDEHERLKNENAKLRGDNDARSKQRDELIQSVANQEGKLKTLRDDIRREDDAISKLRSDAEALRTSINVLGAEETALKTRIETAKQNLLDLPTRIETTTVVLGEKQKELEALEADLTAKQAKYDAANRRLERARQDEAGILRHIEALRATLPSGEAVPPGEEVAPAATAPASTEPDDASGMDGEPVPSDSETDDTIEEGTPE